MNEEVFERQVSAARRRAESLCRDAADAGRAAGLLPEALAELRTALEELSVSEEELRQQNEELVATRAMLEAERLRYRDLFESAPDAYLVTAPDGTVQEANRAAVALLRRPAAFLVGKPLAALVALESRSSFRHHLEQLRAKGGYREWEMRLAPEPEAACDAEVAVAAVRDAAGATVGLRWLLRDVTARRQADRLAAIGQVVSALAHESRNALQRGHACLERLRWRLEGQPELMGLLEGAVSGLEELRRLHEDVRDFAAPLRLRPEACDLAGLWREAWAELTAVHPGRRAELTEEGEAAGCRADPFRLKQVFRNLFDNALAACPDPVRVTVSGAAAELGGRPAVRVSIRDSGPGFTEEQRKRAFEPFYTTRPRGTGLGLALCRRVVEAHGGGVALGPDGPGAEVIITLPRGGE